MLIVWYEEDFSNQVKEVKAKRNICIPNTEKHFYDDCLIVKKIWEEM